LNALKANVYINSGAAYVNAGLTAADAVSAAANAALAAGYAGAAPWVSGSTVAQYAVVSSPINRRSYRKLTTSTGGTTDPSLDPTNYELVPIARPIVHVSGTSVTAVPGFHYSLENAGVTTVMLPPSPASEADVQVTAANGRLDNIIARNAQTIGGAASDLVLDVPSIVLKFLNTSWRAST